MIAFWILAPIIVLAALGLLIVPKAVHAALLLAVVMVSLAVLYLALEAPFLFVVQIIVYTGAILMLFLFVLMLVGVDASDSTVETIAGQRVAAIFVGLLVGMVLVVGAGQITLGTVVGLEVANAGGNVEGIADLLFSRYVFAFEATAALLITAALGAMVLAHRERLEAKTTQGDLAAQRMRDYADSGLHPGPLPPPGVFARHNAVDTPALLPDGSAAESSVSRVLAARGSVRSAPRDVAALQAEIAPAAGFATFSRATAGPVVPAAGAADPLAGGVETRVARMAAPERDEPEQPEADPVTRSLDDAREVDAREVDAREVDGPEVDGRGDGGGR